MITGRTWAQQKELDGYKELISDKISANLELPSWF